MTAPLPPSELRIFLLALTGDGAPTRVPPVLARLARRALQRSSLAGDAGAAEDAIQDAVERLLLDARRTEGASVRELLSLADPALHAALWTRLRQAAAERDPLREERRALHNHVKRALEGPWEPVHAPPTCLTDEHGRFEYALVRAAVWSLRAEPANNPRTAREITAALLRSYFPPRTDVTELDAIADAHATDPEHQAHRALDGQRLAVALIALVGDRSARIVGGIAAGRTLRELSEASGVPIPTIARWHAEAQRRLAVFGARETSFASVGVWKHALAILQHVA